MCTLDKKNLKNVSKKHSLMLPDKHPMKAQSLRLKHCKKDKEGLDAGLKIHYVVITKAALRKDS